MIPFYRPPILSFKEISRLKQKIEQVLSSGYLTNGENCRKLEDSIKEMYHSDYGFVCGSGTTGLWISIKAVKGKRYFLPAFTWKSLKYITPNQVHVDIDLDTWLPYSPEKQRSNDIFISNHTFGNITEYYERCWVINDHACSTGAKIDRIKDISVFSFYPTKNLTTGEGGIILTNNNVLAKTILELRNTCSKMSELQALVGLSYLKTFRKYLEHKKLIYEYYKKHLPFTFQKIDKDFSYGYIGCLVPERDKLVEELKDKVEFRVRYEPLVDFLPNTNKVFSKILLLPAYTLLDPKDIVDLILDVIE